MRIEYAMKSAPQSEADLLALYKSSHARLRGATPRIVKVPKPEPILVEPKIVEHVPVPTAKKEKSYPRWSFVVDKGEFGMSIAETPAPTMTFIKKVVAKKYGVTVLDMESARRTADICRPRQIAAYHCATMTRRSLPAIGRAFGKRDHTTILSSRNKVARRMVADEDFEKEMRELNLFILDTYRDVAP